MIHQDTDLAFPAVAGALEHRAHIQLGRRRPSRGVRARMVVGARRGARPRAASASSCASPTARRSRSCRTCSTTERGRGDRQPPHATASTNSTTAAASSCTSTTSAGCASTPTVLLDRLGGRRRLGRRRTGRTDASSGCTSGTPVGRIDVAWDGELISVDHRPPTAARSPTAATTAAGWSRRRPRAGDLHYAWDGELLLSGRRQRRRRRVRQRVRRRRRVRRARRARSGGSPSTPTSCRRRPSSPTSRASARRWCTTRRGNLTVGHRRRRLGDADHLRRRRSGRAGRQQVGCRMALRLRRRDRRPACDGTTPTGSSSRGPGTSWAGR